MPYIIVFEGIDGSGKSTQVKFLSEYLKSLGFRVLTESWFSNKYAIELLDSYSKLSNANGTTGALIIACEFTIRYHKIINDADDKTIIIFDRYIYTPFVRDTIRGAGIDMLREIYGFAKSPNITLYLSILPELAVMRKSKGELRFFESGMDVYSDISYPSFCKNKNFNTAKECFLRFQNEVISRYSALPEYKNNFIQIDSNDLPEQIFSNIKGHVNNALGI